MQHGIVLYAPSVDQSIERLVERLQRLGYKVELRRIADTGRQRSRPLRDGEGFKTSASWYGS